MGFFSWLFHKNKKEIEESEEISQDYQTDVQGVSHENVDLEDAFARRRFVEDCLEQMSDASNQVDLLQDEYREVTDYLSDIEIVEELPVKDGKKAEEYAKLILYYQEEAKKIKGNPDRMLEPDFLEIEHFADEIPEAIEKMSEAEEYRKKVNSDLKKVENEKSAYKYRKNELLSMQNNMKGVATIVIFAMVFGVILLCVLQFGLKLDTVVGFLIVAVAGAVTLVYIFLRYEENEKELKKIHNTSNRLVRLQNKIKIRYVNNINLLEYMYTKYEVNSAKELKGKWNQYLLELDERQKQDQTDHQMDINEEELRKILRKYKVRNTERWVKQVEAITDKRQLNEIRHNLIIRRTKLRKQLDYNKKIAQLAQEEIKGLISEYPQYAEEIMDQVNRFEQKTPNA